MMTWLMLSWAVTAVIVAMWFGKVAMKGRMRKR